MAIATSRHAPVDYNSDREETVAEFSIDPVAQNPHYKEAMVLAEAERDTQFVTLDLLRGDLSVATLASTWRPATIPVIRDVLAGDVLASVDDLVADDVHGRAVSLSEKGVHPFLENGSWDTRHFSVVAARENILKFYFWLEKEGYPRSANKIKGLFFDFFIDDWDRFFKLCQR